MYKYVLRRVLLAVPVLVLSSLIVFGLMRVMPGDALTALMAESGNVGEKELQKLQRKTKTDVRKFERRGTVARNRLEREVKRTRTRVERQQRQVTNSAKRNTRRVETAANAAVGDVRNGNAQRGAERLQSAATAVAKDVQKQVTQLV